MAQPTTQLNATEQDTLVKQIGLALLRAAPRDWRKVTAEYRAVGRYHELTGEIVTEDGTVHEWLATHDIATLFGRLRGGMYRDGRGTWFNARYQLDHPSSYNLEYNRDEPVWNLAPPPQAYSDELRMFPRTEENVPEWLIRRMSGLGPEQPGPHFRIARIFDTIGPAGRPVINRPDLEVDEQDRLLEYLDHAPLVVTERGYDIDRLAATPEATVPVAFHSDGQWIWPAAVNFYLRKYGVSPELDLVEHVRAVGFKLPPVDEPTLQAAGAYLTRGNPPPPQQQRPAGPPPQGPPPQGPPPPQQAPAGPPPPMPPAMAAPVPAPPQEPPAESPSDYVEEGYDDQEFDDRFADEDYDEQTAGKNGTSPEPGRVPDLDETAEYVPDQPIGHEPRDGSVFQPARDEEPAAHAGRDDAFPAGQGRPEERAAFPEQAFQPGEPPQGGFQPGRAGFPPGQQPEHAFRPGQSPEHAAFQPDRAGFPPGRPEGSPAGQAPEHTGFQPGHEAGHGDFPPDQQAAHAFEPGQAPEDGFPTGEEAEHGQQAAHALESGEPAEQVGFPAAHGFAAGEPQHGDFQPDEPAEHSDFQPAQQAAHAFAASEPPHGDYQPDEHPGFQPAQPPEHSGLQAGQQAAHAFEAGQAPEDSGFEPGQGDFQPGQAPEHGGFPPGRPEHSDFEPAEAPEHAAFQPEHAGFPAGQQPEPAFAGGRPRQEEPSHAAFQPGPAGEHAAFDPGPPTMITQPEVPGVLPVPEPPAPPAEAPRSGRRALRRETPDHPVLAGLQEKLDELDVPESGYKLGEPAEHGWSVEQVDDGWRVGWYDGKLSNPAVFGDAEDAAAFMLGKLLLNPEGHVPAEEPPAPEPEPEPEPEPVPQRVVATLSPEVATGSYPIRKPEPVPPQEQTAFTSAEELFGDLEDEPPAPPRAPVPPTPVPAGPPPVAPQAGPPRREPPSAPTVLAPVPPAPPQRREEPARPAVNGGGGGGQQQWPISPMSGEPPLTLFRGKELRELPAGSELDRFGGPSGNLTYAAGTPFAERSLVPEWVNRPYHVYRVQRPLETLAGVAIPWFNQPGGGAAYLLPASIEELLAEGDLIELDPGEPPID